MKCQFIAILDDSFEVSATLKNKIKNLYPDNDLKIQAFHTPDQLSEFLSGKEQMWGILFIDIVLGKENGITQAIRYRQQSNLWKTVFITGYTDYLSDIFKAEPDGLLFKPIDDAHLKETLQTLIAKIESEDSKYILVDVVRGGTNKLKCSDIVYIESKGRILHLHTMDQTFLTYSKLVEFLPKLPKTFIRTHNSYIVNLQHVQNFQENKLTMSDHSVIPVSRSYKSVIKESFFEQMLLVL